MVQITGDVKSSITRENKVVTVFNIPATAKRFARRRAKINARIKGLDQPKIMEPRMVGQGDIPGQKLYEVEVESNR